MTVADPVDPAVALALALGVAFGRFAVVLAEGLGEVPAETVAEALGPGTASESEGRGPDSVG